MKIRHFIIGFGIVVFAEVLRNIRIYKKRIQNQHISIARIAGRQWFGQRKVRSDMAIIDRCEITAEMNLKKIIAESREVAQALNEFSDNLERIEKKYAAPQESEEQE